ncbi:hypothetical protein M3Y98_00906700 [Aphelenchoides besseyi]|nr:hypothetical protein M3Y98_00906700 [Aphelenchoides besseyi]
MKQLPPDFVIKTKNGTRYKVETRIAEHVYVARSKKTDKLYALKVEMLGQESATKQLKHDVFVLLDASKHQSRFTKHFPHLHNKGKMPGICNYIMMTLCDYNLNDLRAQLLDGCDFSRPNAARLCMQTFQAIHDLHSLGFTHRDISPSKFVLGLDNPHIVYMIGFSMAHHFEQHYDTKLTNSPRLALFLPRAYHRSKDINRKDDLESWVYVCFNLFGRKILPWNDQFSDLNMFVNKERLFCDGFDECYKYVPRQFQTIMHNLDKLGEDERPDYTFIGMMLVTMKENIKFHFYGPFDWQKKEKAHGPVEEKDEGGLAVADKDEVMPTPKKHHQEAAGKRRRGAFQNDDDEDESETEAAVEPKKLEVRKKQKKKMSREEVEEEGQPPARPDAKKRQPKSATTAHFDQSTKFWGRECQRFLGFDHSICSISCFTTGCSTNSKTSGSTGWALERGAHGSNGDDAPCECRDGRQIGGVE